MASGWLSGLVCETVAVATMGESDTLGGLTNCEAGPGMAGDELTIEGLLGGKSGLTGTVLVVTDKMDSVVTVCILDDVSMDCISDVDSAH